MQARFLPAAAIGLLLAGGGGCAPSPEPSVPGNLVSNAALSSPGVGGDAPAGWTFHAWGENLAKGTWIESSGIPGGRALRVEVSRYRDGDAKWTFDRVKLAPDTWYSYSDLHRSDGRSRIILSCRRTSDRSITHHNLWQSGASATWRKEAVRFHVGHAAECEATVSHLVDRDGFLETAQPSLVFAKPEPLPRPLVSLAFDDGWKSALTTARADLEARGFTGSYYLVQSFIDQADGHYASANDLERLLTDAPKKGHEIGSHTLRHRPLSRLPGPERRLELQGNLDWLSERGIEHPGFAYPFGDFDGPTEADVRALHPYARTSFEGLNDGTVDRYRIKILPVTTRTATRTILDTIDEAVRSSTWLVLLFHDLGDPDPANPYRTSYAQYVAVLDRLAAGDVAVVTVAGALKEIEESMLRF